MPVCDAPVIRMIIALSSVFLCYHLIDKRGISHRQLDPRETKAAFDRIADGPDIVLILMCNKINIAILRGKAVFKRSVILM